MLWRLSNPGLGYIPDAKDHRDMPITFALMSSQPPPSASVMDPSVTARSQGSTSSCVGFACAQAVRLAYLATRTDCPDLSPLFTYYLARSQHQSSPVDSGTQIRSAIKAIVALGICSEAAWKFSRLRVNRAPTMWAHRDAHDRKGLRGYYRISSGDLLSVRRAIANGYPVAAGWQVDSAFMDPRGPNLVESFGRPIGGHAMVIVGYDGRTFTLLNSWGQDYRMNGLVKISEEAMTQATDIWALRIRP